MKRLALGIALFIFILGMAFVGGCTFLRSEAGGRFVLRKTQEQFEKLDYQLTATALRIDTFRSLSFTDLKVSKATEDLQLQMFSAKGEIHYRLKFFPLSLHFSKIHVGKTEVDWQKSQTPTEEPASSSLSLQNSFRDLFAKIPLAVSVDDLQIGPVAANLRLRQPRPLATDQIIHFEGLTLAGQGAISADQFSLTLKVAMPESAVAPGTLEQHSLPNLQNSEDLIFTKHLQAEWRLGAEVRLRVDKVGRDIRFQAEAMALQGQLENLKIRNESLASLEQSLFEKIQFSAGAVPGAEIFHWRIGVQTEGGKQISNGTTKSLPSAKMDFDLETNETLQFLRAKFALKDQDLKVVQGSLSLLENQTFLRVSAAIDLPPKVFTSWRALLPAALTSGPANQASEVQLNVELNIDLNVATANEKAENILTVPWSELTEIPLQATVKVQATVLRLPQLRVKNLDLNAEYKRLEPSKGEYRMAVDLQENHFAKSFGQFQFKTANDLQIDISSEVHTQHLPASLPFKSSLATFGLPALTATLKGRTAWPLPKDLTAADLDLQLGLQWQKTAAATSFDPGQGDLQLSVVNGATARSAKGQLNFSQAQKVGLAAMQKGDLEFSAHQTGVFSKENFRARANGRLAGLRFLGRKASLNDSAKDFTSVRFSASAEGRGQTIDLTQAKVVLGEGLVNAELSGKALMREKEVQMEGQLGIDLSREMNLLGVHRMSGRLSAPLSLYVRANEWFNLDGKLKFANFFYAGNKIQLRGVSGTLPFQERLIVRDGKFSFAELLQLNTFTRVTFDRVEPLLVDAAPLTIREIVMEDKAYGPLTLFGLLRQNLLLGQKVDLTLGQGQMAGEFYLDLHPRTLSLGLLTRLTNVRPNEILPKSFRGQGTVSGDPISARTALVYEVNSRSLEGKVDVTQIGQSQLLTLINVVDPEYRDDRLNQARSVLAFAYPTSVAAQFSQGAMDLEIALNIGKPIPKIRGIAISPFLTDISRKIRTQVKEVVSE